MIYPSASKFSDSLLLANLSFNFWRSCLQRLWLLFEIFILHCSFRGHLRTGNSSLLFLRIFWLFHQELSLSIFWDRIYCQPKLQQVYCHNCFKFVEPRTLQSKMSKAGSHQKPWWSHHYSYSTELIEIDTFLGQQYPIYQLILICLFKFCMNGVESRHP